MRKLYQKEWMGIEFKSFTKLDSRKLADISFYDKFYDEFYKKYSFYEELPQKWRVNKEVIKDFILHQTNKNDRLLSIGCGCGYIEYLLRKEGRNITAIEPSPKATKFLEPFDNLKIYHGYFPDCLRNTNESPFDLAYMVATDYIFNKKGLTNLIKNIKVNNIKNFLLISVNVINQTSISQLVKYFVKSALEKVKLYDLGQLWGYSRKPEEYLQVFKRAGFKKIERGFLNNFFWIKGY